VILWSAGYFVAAVLSYIGVHTGLVSLSIVLISVAVGLMAFTLGPMWAVVQELTPLGMTGLGTGFVNGVAYIASAFGPALVGAIVDRTGSYAVGFYILAGWLIVTGLALIPLWRGYLPVAASGKGSGSALTSSTHS
jgi:cyanate permease